MHTSLVSGQASIMLLYELVILDLTDPVFNPVWRQGCFILPFASKLGVKESDFSWEISPPLARETSSYWTLETVYTAHSALSGLLVLSSSWHWTYWDLRLFICSCSGQLTVDLLRVFGIHLTLASSLCSKPEFCHLCGFLGSAGIRSSDSLGLLGSVRYIKPAYSLISLTPPCFGPIPAHHIISGVAGPLLASWHISSRPGNRLYRTLSAGNIESVLSSSVKSVLFTEALVGSLVWYGSVTNPTELLGPSRYQWDNNVLSSEISRRVRSNPVIIRTISWQEMPDKLILYDYIRGSPAKGGLFRSKPMLKGDGCIQS